MDIIPNTVVGAFAQGEILQVLFFAVLFAFGLQTLGERGQALLGVIDQASHALFAVVGIIMKVGAARGLRRDGLHHRQVRRRDAWSRSPS